jgi:hypothetical protein
MVMTQNGQEEQSLQPGLLDITPQEGDAPVEAEPIEAEPIEAEPVEAEAVEAEAVPAQPAQATPAPVAESPPAKSHEQIQEELRRTAELEELGNRRTQETEQRRRQELINRARVYEQGLQDDGLLPEQARKQTRQMVSYENRLQQQDSQAMQLLQFTEGRNIAALQIGMENGLVPKQVLADINVLLRSQSPDAMKYEAKRMAELRGTRAELTRLKQGQVAPQTFDNSQGSAEATTSEGRLVDAYLAGDRSEAAVKAARKLTFGS